MKSSAFNSRSLFGRTVLIATIGIAIAVFATPSHVTAQDEAAVKKDRSAMGVRHQRIEQMMLELDRKFNTLSEKLQKTEPERAKRLVEALQKAKELLIQKRLGEITSLLNDARYDSALDEQQEILTNLKELIKLLLNEQLDEDKLAKEEKDALEKIKRDLQDIIKDENRQEAESRKLANKDQTLDDLDAQIDAVKKLIKKQNEVNSETDANKDRGIQALDGVANKQHDVRKETEDVASKIAKQGMPEPEPEDGEPKDGEPKDGQPKDGQPKDGQPKDGQPKDGQPKDGQPKDGQPKDGQPKDGQPKDGQPKDGQPKDGQPKDGQPKDGQPKDGQPKDGQPKDGQPKDGQPKDGQPKDGQPKDGQPKDDPGRPPQPGEQPLKKAAEKQKTAEEKLSRGKPKEAQEAEKKASEELEKALAELEKEKRRIATLPPEAFDKLAKDQKDIEKKVAKLQEKMDEAAKKKAEAKGDESGDSPPKTPGQEQVKKAQEAMKNASKNLEDQDPQAANRQQKEAIKQMKEALREIEERLKQLREETQEEKLARLEARFTEMLAKQQLASALTKQLHDKRVSSGNDRLRRGDLLQIAKLTASEREIAELAQDAHDILAEDGTSVVFPEVVLDLKEDLLGVGDLLEETRTDELTQGIQYEIEVTLQELLEALKKEQRQRAGGGGGGGGGGGNPPLLPKSAELKMLRSAQLRVNRRTKKFDEIRGDAELDEGLGREIENIADRQLKIIDLTEQVIQKAP